MSRPQDGAATAADSTAEVVGKSLVEQVITTGVGIAAGAIGGPLAGMAAAAAVGVAIDLAPKALDAAERMVDAVSATASDAAATISSALGSDAAPTPDTAAKPVTNIGAAADTHVVAPTTAELERTASVLTSEGHTLAGARGGAGASTATTEPSPETRAAAAKIAKAAENTDIGMAAHKAVKVDSKAPEAFNKIQALLLDSTKTSGEKLTAVLKMEVIEDSSFKAFLGIAQDALRMDRIEGAETYHEKTSADVSEFLTSLSKGFAKIFTPEPGKSREGGAEEMNAAFAVCGESMKVGIGKLPAMQEAIGAGFESGFKEAAKAAEEAREEEAKKARAPQTALASADAPKAVAPKEKPSLKEIGKDSLKIAGSIALSLLVPGGFLIAMAACYMLRDKAPSKEEGLPDIDASLPITASSRSSKAPAAPAAPSASAAIPSTPAAPAVPATPAAPSASAAIPSTPAAPAASSTASSTAPSLAAALEKATMDAVKAGEAAIAEATKQPTPSRKWFGRDKGEGVPKKEDDVTMPNDADLQWKRNPMRRAAAAPSASTPAVAVPAVVGGGGIGNAAIEAEAAGVKSALAGLEVTEAKVVGSGKPDAIMAKGEGGERGR